MNKYEIVGIVGEGAYGIVYKAKNKETGEHGKPTLLLIVLYLNNVCSCDKEVQGEHRGG
jgi:serine/threonine protein kinase